MGQSALSVLLGGSADCNPAPLIWPIFVGIILGIVVVGILAVVLWRCCTYLGEYLEYRQWMKSVEDQSARVREFVYVIIVTLVSYSELTSYTLLWLSEL